MNYGKRGGLISEFRAAVAIASKLNKYWLKIANMTRMDVFSFFFIKKDFYLYFLIK